MDIDLQVNLVKERYKVREDFQRAELALRNQVHAVCRRLVTPVGFVGLMTTEHKAEAQVLLKASLAGDFPRALDGTAAFPISAAYQTMLKEKRLAERMLVKEVEQLPVFAWWPSLQLVPNCRERCYFPMPVRQYCRQRR